jgi:cytochrome b561
MKREYSTYGIPTRLVHAALAVAVTIQLVTSLTMEADHGGDGVFQIHRIGGLAAFGLVLVFWFVTVIRRRGTPLGRLLPWFSARRRAELWQDVGAHLRSLPRLSFPAEQGDVDDALASAVHGLGLLLMTAMAGSGFLYFLLNTGDPDAGGLVGLAMLVHTSLANLAWAYLIGHAATAVLHSLAGRSIGRMWSLAAPE